MTGMTLKDIISITGARVSGCADTDAAVGKIVIDSREACPGDIFAAFRGEHTDGHAYMNVAFGKGASCCIGTYAPDDAAGPVLVVDDVLEAINRITAFYRGTLSIPVVGITGSVGKTTCKEMVSAVLSAKTAVLKTAGNLNNTIGVPMTLSRIGTEHGAAVIEMGISAFGEMTVLAETVRPDIAVFTCIGHAHLEFLNDLDGVFRAKTEMLPFVSENGVIIANGDDAKLINIRDSRETVFYGFGSNCAVRAEKLECRGNSLHFDIVYGGRKIKAEVPGFGRYLVSAALAGAAVGFKLGMTDEEIASGLLRFSNVGRRGQIRKGNGFTVIDDCYNANPDSVAGALDSLSLLEGRKIAVLGDMLELGELSGELHRETGRRAAEVCDAVLCCGKFAAFTAEGAGPKGKVFENKTELADYVRSTAGNGEAVLIKASRGSHFEEIADSLSID